VALEPFKSVIVSPGSNIKETDVEASAFHVVEAWTNAKTPETVDVPVLFIFAYALSPPVFDDIPMYT
jgi:hypothetical protein